VNLGIDGDQSAMRLFETWLRAGLHELEASRRVPALIQRAADVYVDALAARQARAENRRPVPPSFEGLVEEQRMKLRRNRDHKRRRRRCSGW
jgi:hypothetical protein